MGKILLSNIAEELAVRNGLTREAADNFMHAFVETVEKGLKEDGMVKVRGLGTFKLQEMSERDSVDVNTGERITIKGYRKVTFTPDSTMKELVNRPFAHFEPTELNDGYPAEEELVTSDDITEDNDGGEVAEESVETLAEEAVAAVESPQEAIADTVEIASATETEEDEPVAEDTMDESVVEDAIENVAVEEPTEQSDPEQEETPKSEDNSAIGESLEQEPKKRRGCGCWVVLAVLIALAGMIAFTFGWLPLPECDEARYEEDIEEYGGIVVKPNLEEELGAEWGDDSKVVTPPAKSVVVESIESVVAEPAKPVVVEPVEPVALELTKPVDVPSGYVTLTKELASKAVKEISLADTTDYVIDGTLVSHKLKSGETIIQLANKYYGDKRLWPYIVKYNRMKNFNKVAIGQVIDIPLLKENR